MDLEQLLRLIQLGGPSSTMGTLANGAAKAGGTSLLGLAGGPAGVGLSLLPILMSIFGGDPQRANRQRVAELLSPEHLAQVQQEVLRRMGSSPDAIAARNSIVSSGTSLANRLNSSFAARGLGTTGIAAAALPIARTATAGRLSNYSAQLGAGALDQARQLIRDQVQGFETYPYGQSRLQAGIGGTLDAWQPLLREYFNRRFNSQYSPALA